MFPNPLSFLQASATGATEFIIKVKTDNTGSSNNDQFTIPTFGTATYDYTVDWGDGSDDTGQLGNITHTYAAAGEYEIKISGTFPRIYFNSTGDEKKLLEIVNWGNNPWTSMDRAFWDCINMDITATDAPDFSNVTSFYNGFRGCTSMTTTGTSADWLAPSCTRMDGMLYDCRSLLTCDASNWNTSSVETMEYFFYNCKLLTTLYTSGWYTSSLGTGSITNVSTKCLYRAFLSCHVLTTLDVSGWDVSNVASFQELFENCYALNGINVSEWDTSNLVITTEMFRECQALTSLDLGSWNVSSLTTLQAAFYNCDVLTTIGDISGWSTGVITNLIETFRNTDALTVDLTGLGSNIGAAQARNTFILTSGSGVVTGYDTWDVSNITSFQATFQSAGATNFATFPETWDMTSGTNFLQTFYKAGMLTGSIDCTAMKFGPVASLSQMFRQNPNNTNLTDITFGPDCDFSTTSNLSFFISGHTGLTDINWDAGLDLSALSNASNLMTSPAEMGGAGGTANYDLFLIALDAGSGTPGTLSAGASTYSAAPSAAATAHASLNTKGWAISDGGPI